MTDAARSWLDPHRGEPDVAVADAAAARLGAQVQAQLLAAGDRLARRSDGVALAFYRQAAEAYEIYGTTGFERWFALGAALLEESPSSRAGAAGLFALPPRGLSLDAAAEWYALGRRLSKRARHLGFVYFERTASVISAPDGLARLAAWVEAGMPLIARASPHAGAVAEAYFEGAPASVSMLAEPARWVRALLALGGAIEWRAFSAPSLGLRALAAAEQARFLDVIERLAPLDADGAARVYRELPRALALLPRAARAAVIAVLAAADGVAGRMLAELASKLPSTLAAVPPGELEAALAQVVELAALQPSAAAAALAHLPELYRQADAGQVTAWFEAGRRLAAANAAATLAFFALESRTSISVLRSGSSAVALDDALGVWRKLIQMMSGAGVVIERGQEASLRPPLEAAPGDGYVTLPERMEWLGTKAQNHALYRFLALQLAGRREFGTYRQPDLRARLRRAGEAAAWEDLFLLTEGVRVQARLARVYAGSVAETRATAKALLAAWREQEQEQPTLARVCDTLFAVALVGSSEDVGLELLPRWLPLTAAEALLALLTPLWRAEATVNDALAIARKLLAWIAAGALTSGAAELAADGGELDDAARLSAADARESEREAASIALSAGSTPTSGPLPPDAQVREEAGAPAESEDFAEVDGLPAEQEAADEEALQGHVITARRPPRRGSQIAQTFLYDEWDHTIADYRSRHCRVHEIEQTGDSGAFFERTRTEYAHMLSDVRRQFERMRPERYRPVRGLEDGEDFDLNALIDARVEARARRTPETRIYTARKRQQRDVATLFLLDMSASTEQPFVEPGQPPAHRIIDTLKEALVVMSSALDSLGDQYAMYGFSSRGRSQVEVYVIKSFAETLSASVRARIGGISPKSGTRMGAALRHVLEKFAHVHAQSKHLILLSDGFPQDQDYGPDRRTHTYGIEDTAVALREVSARGTTPFCITVDRAGNDYLRRMCEPSQYLVIDHVEELPRELPKVYRSVVQS